MNEKMMLPKNRGNPIGAKRVDISSNHQVPENSAAEAAAFDHIEIDGHQPKILKIPWEFM